MRKHHVPCQWASELLTAPKDRFLSDKNHGQRLPLGIFFIGGMGIGGMGIGGMVRMSKWCPGM